jgi:hypothetical protein
MWLKFQTRALQGISCIIIVYLIISVIQTSNRVVMCCSMSHVCHLPVGTEAKARPSSLHRNKDNLLHLPPTFLFSPKSLKMRPILLSGHERSLTQCIYNQDGDLIFSTSKDHNASVWFSHNGERWVTSSHAFEAPLECTGMLAVLNSILVPHGTVRSAVNTYLADPPFHSQMYVHKAR